MTVVSLQLQRRSISTPFGRLSVLYRPSQGPVVLLIHGNSSCKEIFLHQFSMLAETSCGVLAPDLPGHGESDDYKIGRLGYSFPAYADAMRRLLDTVAAKNVHVFGWSLGGHIALELLGRDRRIRSVMIAGTPPVELGPNALQGFVLSPAMRFAGKRHFTPYEARRYGALMVGGDELLTPHLLRAVYRTDGNARFWMVRNGLAGHGLNEKQLVQTDTRPLAVIHGQNEPFVSFDYIAGLAYRNLWRGSIQTVSGAGHAPHWQAPDSFNRLFREFLTCTT
jgi:pimeloyl-ACP methyl ester carboxylesterase